MGRFITCRVRSGLLGRHSPHKTGSAFEKYCLTLTRAAAGAKPFLP